MWTADITNRPLERVHLTVLMNYEYGMKWPVYKFLSHWRIAIAPTGEAFIAHTSDNTGGSHEF